MLQDQDKLLTAKENLNNLLGRDLNIAFQAAEDKELSPVEDRPEEPRRPWRWRKIPRSKKRRSRSSRPTMCRRLAKSRIYAGYWRLLPLSFALRSQFCSHQCHGRWASSSAGSRLTGDGASDVVNEKTIAVEQSKLNLDQTKAKSWSISISSSARCRRRGWRWMWPAPSRRPRREAARSDTCSINRRPRCCATCCNSRRQWKAPTLITTRRMATFWTAKANFQKALGEE